MVELWNFPCNCTKAQPLGECTSTEFDKFCTSQGIIH